MSMLLRALATLLVAAACLVLLYGSPGLLPGGDDARPPVEYPEVPHVMPHDAASVSATAPTLDAGPITERDEVLIRAAQLQAEVDRLAPFAATDSEVAAELESLQEQIAALDPPGSTLPPAPTATTPPILTAP